MAKKKIVFTETNAEQEQFENQKKIVPAIIKDVVDYLTIPDVVESELATAIEFQQLENLGKY